MIIEVVMGAEKDHLIFLEKEERIRVVKQFLRIF